MALEILRPGTGPGHQTRYPQGACCHRCGCVFLFEEVNVRHKAAVPNHGVAGRGAPARFYVWCPENLCQAEISVPGGER